jgi:glycogen debranching enzyme
VVDAIERRLLTPMGLRSLAPEDPRYVRRYVGGVLERDSSYHQGTVWPWLLGAFVEAWIRTGKGSKLEAKARFLDPIAASSAGGHIAEIADAEPPHAPRGCPFQAWSVGEVLRSLELVGQPARRRAAEKKPAAARTGVKRPTGPSPSV